MEIYMITKYYYFLNENHHKVIKNIFLCCDLIKGPLKTLQNIMLTKLTFKYKLNENKPPKFGTQRSHCSAGV